MALVVDATTKEKSAGRINTGIRCFQKKCDGMISSELHNSFCDIHWDTSDLLYQINNCPKVDKFLD